MILSSFFADNWLRIVLLVLCILLSGLFSSAELAYTVVNKLRLKKEAENGGKLAKKALNIADDYDNTITTILFGNNLVNIACSSLATLICLALFKTNSSISDSDAAAISSIIVFVFLVIFGEVIPKNIGMNESYRLSKFYAWIIQILKYVFFPITFLVKLIVKVIVKILPKNKEKEPSVTDEELIEMVDTIEEEGVIDEKQSELLKSAIDFCDTTVYEIMTPRVDIFAIDINEVNNSIYDEKDFAKYSRIPIYMDSIDNIIGIVSVKTILKLRLKGEPIDLNKLMVEPLYVPKSKQISSLLKEFKETHNHIAVIIDEFGGTEGIVTMEDIVEELVGEIWDETDEVEEDYKRKNSNTYEVDGSMNIDDFFALVGIDTEIDSDYTTVSGFCIEKLERFAQVGDAFDFENITIEILEVDEFTIEKIKVIVNEDEEEED